MTKPLKLTIELVPRTSWYNNMRKVVSRSTWDKIRRKAYADYGYKCGICDAKGRLSCHEIWEYHDQTHEQKLLGFIALCNWCHHVKHIGLAGILASRGELDYKKVVEHFMKVNQCDRATFDAHSEQAFRQWRERSQHNWHVSLGPWFELKRCWREDYLSEPHAWSLYQECIVV